MKITDETKLADLDISFRTLNTLAYKKIYTVGDLKKFSYTEIKKIRNMCRKVLEEITNKIDKFDIKLKNDDKEV